MKTCQKTRVKLTSTQLSKLKKTAKMLWINKKKFRDEKLPHELLLTTRKTTKIRNPFARNISLDMKLVKAQISQLIQSGGVFGSWLANLGKKKH